MKRTCDQREVSIWRKIIWFYMAIDIYLFHHFITEYMSLSFLGWKGFSLLLSLSLSLTLLLYLYVQKPIFRVSWLIILRDDLRDEIWRWIFHFNPFCENFIDEKIDKVSIVCSGDKFKIPHESEYMAISLAGFFWGKVYAKI